MLVELFHESLADARKNRNRKDKSKSSKATSNNNKSSNSTSSSTKKKKRSARITQYYVGDLVQVNAEDGKWYDATIVSKDFTRSRHRYRCCLCFLSVCRTEPPYVNIRD